jgi:hypothetical protein
LPSQTNNFDCGIFVLAYQRAAQTWINTHLPSAQTSRHSDHPSQSDTPAPTSATSPEPPPPEGPHEDTDTDNPTPDMLAQFQHDLTELPNLIQSPMDSQTYAPQTPPPEPAETCGPNAASIWQSRPYPVITPSNTSSPRWQQLKQDPTELDIGQLESFGWA